VTDPAVEAAKRVGETLPYGFSSKLTSRHLIAAAREALAPLRELHKLTSDEYGRPGLICDDCDHDWPCPTARLIYRGDEL
jgi:hypothetical protein